MNCAQRNCVYAFYLGLFICPQGIAAFGKGESSKEGKLLSTTATNSINNNRATNSASLLVNNTTGKIHATNVLLVPVNNISNNNRAVNTASVPGFQWSEEHKLSWDDFNGPVKAETGEAAAATHCGIGFKTARSDDAKKLEIIVYNTFYVNKSWVRPDAKIASILDHEQGHFDLCELYTRMLRKRMNEVNITSGDMRPVLEHIYFDVKNEYENRQQAYEQETIHGTDIPKQKRWQKIIAMELNPGNENNNSSNLLSNN